MFQQPPTTKEKHSEEKCLEPTPCGNHNLLPSVLTSVRLSFVISCGFSQLNWSARVGTDPVWCLLVHTLTHGRIWEEFFFYFRELQGILSEVEKTDESRLQPSRLPVCLPACCLLDLFLAYICVNVKLYCVFWFYFFNSCTALW